MAGQSESERQLIMDNSVLLMELINGAKSGACRIEDDLLHAISVMLERSSELLNQRFDDEVKR